MNGFAVLSNAGAEEGLKKSRLLRGCEMDGLRVEVVVVEVEEECEEFCDD